MPSYENIEGKHCWHLTARELDYIYDLSVEILKAKGKDPRHMDGRRIERNVEGYMAEYAACAHYGCFFDWAVYKGHGDKGRDLAFIRGNRLYTMGVKSVRDENRRLAVKSEERHKSTVPNAYLLCSVSFEHRLVILKGYALAKDVFNRPTTKLRDDGYDNYVVENFELKEVSTPLCELELELDNIKGIRVKS